MRTLLVVLSLASLSALAADKPHKCAAYKEDGTLIAESSYPPGTVLDCTKVVDAEARKVLCSPGATKAKYLIKMTDVAKPLPSTLLCKTPSTKASDSPCLGECRKTNAACGSACPKGDRDCNIKCFKTYSACTKQCEGK